MSYGQTRGSMFAALGEGRGMGCGRGFLVTALTPDGLSTLRPSLLEEVVEGELRG